MKMNKKGFTLIEMLVVIAIIAVLVAIIVPTVNSATGKAKAATDAANLRSALATATIKALDDTTATTYSATQLNVPAKGKYDGGDFHCTVAVSGTEVVCKVWYGGDTAPAAGAAGTIEYYAGIAEKGHS